MKPTPEQHGIQEAACAKKNLIVRSFVETGKTTTTQYVIENIWSPKTPVLYLTFAVSNVEEAKQKMGHIEVLKITNIHKLAFETVGCLYANKLGDMSVRDYKNLLKSTIYDAPMTVKKAITAFINSTDKTLQKKHVLTVKTYNYKQIGLNPKVVELSKAVLKVKVTYADLKGTDSLDTHIRPPRHTIEGERVVLHRTAAGVLRISLNLYQRQIPFIVLGGLAKYFTQELAWFEKIKAGDTKGIPKSFLATYPT